MHAHSLTPKLREAVTAAFRSPGHRLVRCAGGYKPNQGSDAQAITRRAVNMLERDYVLRYEGDMHASAVLTSKGERIASELLQAGAK